MESLTEKIGFLRDCHTSIVADAYIRLGLSDKMPELTVDSTLCGPFNREDRFAGVAVPVYFSIPIGSQSTWSMFDLIGTHDPGTVFVMKGCGDRCHTGDVYVRYAAAAGMSAFVVEGFVRDSRDISTSGMPVFCKGATPAAKGYVGTKITAYGEPMNFYHMRINPGDIIVGDCDGVVRIPPELLDDVIEQAYDLKDVEDAFNEAFADYRDKGDKEALLSKLRSVGIRKGVR